MRPVAGWLVTGVVAGLAAASAVWYHDTATHETVEALTAQHATDSVAADAASAIATRAVATADSLRRAYRARPSLHATVAPLTAALDSATQTRQMALDALVDAQAGVDSLRAVIRRLVAEDAHRDTLTRTVVEALGAQVTAAGRVIAQDSLSLTAMVAARDAERARAASAERLVAGWQREAARQARVTRVWQGVAGAVAVGAVMVSVLTFR